MRFDRYEIGRGPELVWTTRRAAALRRKQRLEREALPLFASQVAALQPTEHEVRSQREATQAAWRADMRRNTALMWRQARRALYALPVAARQEVLAAWNTAGCPGSCGYFADAVHRAYKRLGFAVEEPTVAWRDRWDAAIARAQAAREAGRASS